MRRGGTVRRLPAEGSVELSHSRARTLPMQLRLSGGICNPGTHTSERVQMHGPVSRLDQLFRMPASEKTNRLKGNATPAIQRSVRMTARTLEQEIAIESSPRSRAARRRRFAETVTDIELAERSWIMCV